MDPLKKIVLIQDGTVDGCSHDALSAYEDEGYWRMACDVCDAIFGQEDDPEFLKILKESEPPEPGSPQHRVVLIMRLAALYDELRPHLIDDPIGRMEAIEKIRDAEAPLDEWHPGWRDDFPGIGR
jgi:hypothetical protein